MTIGKESVFFYIFDPIFGITQHTPNANEELLEYHLTDVLNCAYFPKVPKTIIVEGKEEDVKDVKESIHAICILGRGNVVVFKDRSFEDLLVVLEKGEKCALQVVQ